MRQKPKQSNKKNKKQTEIVSSPFSVTRVITVTLSALVLGLGIYNLGYFFPQKYDQSSALQNGALVSVATATPTTTTPTFPPIDPKAYDAKLNQLAHYVPRIATTTLTSANGSSTATTTIQEPPRLWPVKSVYPNPGALLPFNRIVAYYGNLYSTQMGALGQYPREEMLSRLMTEVHKWEAADPTTPVIPALHYIALTAQGSPGVDGKYRLRMPDSEIDKIIDMAKEVNGVVFLDLQVALSDLPTELPYIKKYLEMPQVHLGIDPEFSMKYGDRPGTVIGTFDASDINYAANYLADIVKENHLPPKILVVHRFTRPMVTNYKQIKPLPDVQIVMDMDGWGPMYRKIDSYDAYIYSEPVQFTGFKLFYKNDVKTASSTIMSPQQVLKLTPSPSYIQYQ